MVGLLRLCCGRLTVTMVLSQLTVVAVLGLCVRMQGLDRSTISWAVILVAWGLVTFASLLIPIGLTAYLHWRGSTACRRPVNSRGPSAEPVAAPASPWARR